MAVIQYKILMTGKNSAVIDDFYNKLGDVFECQTTSTRLEDIVSHLEYFSPNAFLYCMNMESARDIERMRMVKQKLNARNTPFMIIGNEPDCMEFNKMMINVADLVLIKPLETNIIQSRIINYLLKEKRQEEERQMMKLQEEKRRLEEERERALLFEHARQKHILVVDDDVLMLKIIKEYLHDDYDVATAVNGKVALRFLETKRTDLILLDYEMPV